MMLPSASCSRITFSEIQGTEASNSDGSICLPKDMLVSITAGYHKIYSIKKNKNKNQKQKPQHKMLRPREVTQLIQALRTHSIKLEP